MNIESKMKNLYLSRIPSVKYLFTNGKEAIFILGRFLTDVEEEIKQLDAEIKQGHPHIYVDPNKKVVDAKQEDPVEAIKKAAIAEYLAQQRALDPNKDAGTSDTKFKVVGNSTNAPGAVQPKPVGNPANQQLIGAPKLDSTAISKVALDTPSNPALTGAFGADGTGVSNAGTEAASKSDKS